MALASEKLQSIKAKIAKMLRLSSSSNVNEAAAASDMVRKMCMTYGISLSEVGENYDEMNEIISQEFINSKRVNAAAAILLRAIAYYFDCKVIVNKKLVSTKSTRRVYETSRTVYGSKSNMIQCELYFDYLNDVMNDMCEGAKLIAMVNDQPITRNFRTIFENNFADAIQDRLVQMKDAELKKENAEKEYRNEESSGLIRTSASERDRVESHIAKIYGKLRKVGNYAKMGYGNAAEAGKRCGNSVGLSRQIQSKTLALPGA